jgi:hypothetical protein
VTKVIAHRPCPTQLCPERLPITAKQIQNDLPVLAMAVCGAQKNEK